MLVHGLWLMAMDALVEAAAGSSRDDTKRPDENHINILVRDEMGRHTPSVWESRPALKKALEEKGEVLERKGGGKKAGTVGGKKRKGEDGEGGSGGGTGGGGGAKKGKGVGKKEFVPFGGNGQSLGG